MRYLTIVRHCEAGEAANDYDRTLTTRGRAQAEQLRRWVEDPDALATYGPTTALVSAAARTRETYALGFAGTAFVNALETSELIYNGRREVTGEDLLAQLAELDPVRDSLLVIAHNPSVFDLVATLTSELPEVLARGEYPVGTAVVLAVPDNTPVGRATYECVATFVPA